MFCHCVDVLLIWTSQLTKTVCTFASQNCRALTYRNAVQHCVSVFNQISLNSSFKYVWKTKASQTLRAVKGKFPFTWKRTLNLCSEEERVCASVIKHYRNTYSLCQSEMDAMTSLISHVHILYIFMVWLYCTVVMLQVFILVSELSLHGIISIFYCSTLFKVSFF